MAGSTGESGMRSELRMRQRNESLEKNIIIELTIVFCLLVSLGFPGNFTVIYGEKAGKLLEYLGFLAEILLIMMSSGETWQDVELLHLDKKYAALYLYVLFTFGQSMLVTAYPKEQVITCLRLVVTLFFVIWLQEKFKLEQILEMFNIAQGVFILATLFFMARHPGMAYESGKTFSHALNGLYPSKNICATEFGFGIIMNVLLINIKFRKRQLKRRWLILLFVQLVLLFMCQATGPVITMILAVLSVFVFPRQRLPLGLIYITVNVVFLFAMLTMMPLFEGVITAMGKDATLTGRIPMWNRIITVMTENNTMMGFGYGMFWRDTNAVRLFQSAFSMRKDSFMATHTNGAHNVIMEMWLNSGLLGIAAFFATMLFSFRNIAFLDEERYHFCASVIVYLMINGLTERCLGGNYDFKTVGVFLAMALCSNQHIVYRLHTRSGQMEDDDKEQARDAAEPGTAATIGAGGEERYGVIR